MKINILALTILAGVALAGCVPEEGTETNNSASNTEFSLAGFYAWPEGKTEAADLSSMGRDNIMLVVDRSGSMNYSVCNGNGSRSDSTKTALREFIPQIPADVAVGYLDFGSDVYETVPLGVNNRSQLMQAAANHTGNLGGTNLTDAVHHAFNILGEQALVQGSTGTYRIVIITDGAADSSWTLERKLAEVNVTPVEVYTAGFCIEGDHALNQEGDTIYTPANDVDELVTILSAAVQDEAPNFTLDFANSAK